MVILLNNQNYTIYLKKKNGNDDKIKQVHSKFIVYFDYFWKLY